MEKTSLVQLLLQFLLENMGRSLSQGLWYTFNKKLVFDYSYEFDSKFQELADITHVQVDL